MPCGWFVRGVGAAQQPQRAAPHTGVPEIGAALCDCYADAVEGAQGQFEYRMPDINGRLPNCDGGSSVGCVAFICQIGLQSSFYKRCQLFYL